MVTQMRWKGAVVALSIGLMLAACSDAKKPPRDHRDDDDGEAKSSASATPAPSGATAPIPVRAGSPLSLAVRPGAMHAGYANVKGLRDRGWFKFLDALPPEMSGPVGELVTKCGSAPWSLVDEIAWSGSKGDDLVIVASLAAPPDAVLACIRGVAPGAERQDKGADRGFAWGRTSAVIHQGLLVVGTGRSFQDVTLDVPAPGSPLLDKVAPAANQLLRISVDAKALPGAPADAVDLTMTSTDTEMSIEALVRASNDAAAGELEKRARGMIEQLESMKEAATLPPMKVSRDGDVVRFVVSKKGDATEQAGVLGTTSAIAIYGIRRYLQNAKLAEAKNTVSAIARSIVAWSESESVDAKGNPMPRHRCPPSAAPVPKDIPAGRKYQSSDADWGGTWHDIRFMMTSPQYYRYRIDSSPDAMKCSVVAEGDLDANGKTSKVSLGVSFDAQGNPKIDTELQLHDELE
jgi:hypothetical protein